MELKIGNKKLNVKFSYKPTLKERIMSRLAKFDSVRSMGDAEQAEVLEDLLLFLPEFLLVGLQANHEEYRYDYETGEGKDKCIDEAFSLIDEYFETEDGDAMELFQKLQEEMFNNSFLKKMFQEEKKKVQEKQEKG